MNHTKSYKDKNITIIVNKKLKNSYISIDRAKNLTIKTPYKSEAFIERLLAEKASWIEKQLAKFEESSTLPQEPLHSIEFIKDRVAYFAQEMKLEFSELKIKKMRSRWGSCSSKKVITLNSELTKLKEEHMEYVVVHELAHLVHMNHSKEFHTLVEHYLKDAKRHRQELKKISLLPLV